MDIVPYRNDGYIHMWAIASIQCVPPMRVSMDDTILVVGVLRLKNHFFLVRKCYAFKLNSTYAQSWFSIVEKYRTCQYELLLWLKEMEASRQQYLMQYFAAF